MSENNFEYDQPILCLLKMIPKQVSFVLLGYMQACHETGFDTKAIQRIIQCWKWSRLQRII